MLNIQNAENKNKLVEDKIPESIFEVLCLSDAKFTKDQMLNQFSDENKDAIGSVHQHLARRK